MDIAEVKSKVLKLYRLSTSDNPHESRLAVQLAQKLVDKYDLNLTEILKDDITKSGGTKCEVIIDSKILDAWNWELIRIIAL